MKYQRVLICGSRWWGRIQYETGDTPEMRRHKDFINAKQIHLFYRTLDQFLRDGFFDENLTVIEGDAPGVDALGGLWAKTHYFDLKPFPADWDTYGKKAGTIRNKQMLDEGKPDLVIAFLTPDSRGTRNMIMQAEKVGVPVFKVEWTRDMESELWQYF